MCLPAMWALTALVFPKGLLVETLSYSMSGPVSKVLLDQFRYTHVGQLLRTRYTTTTTYQAKSKPMFIKGQSDQLISHISLQVGKVRYRGYVHGVQYTPVSTRSVKGI